MSTPKWTVDPYEVTIQGKLPMTRYQDYFVRRLGCPDIELFGLTRHTAHDLIREALVFYGYDPITAAGLATKIGVGVVSLWGMEYRRNMATWRGERGWR